MYKNFLENLKCPCCNNFFIDIHRPYLLKCGHNLCSICININKLNYTCLICLQKYNEIEIQNCTTLNFLIDEEEIKLKEKELNNKDKDNKINIGKGKEGRYFFCEFCLVESIVIGSEYKSSRIFIFQTTL